MKNQAQYDRTCALIAALDLAILNDGLAWELKNARDLLDKYRDKVQPVRNPTMTYREG